MIRWSGIALVAVGILHVIVLGKDALPHVPDWLRLQLWTGEHWRPFERSSGWRSLLYGKPAEVPLDQWSDPDAPRR